MSRYYKKDENFKQFLKNQRTLVEQYTEPDRTSGYAIYKPYRALPFYRMYVWVNFAPVEDFRPSPLVLGAKTTYWGRNTDMNRFIDMRAQIIADWIGH